MCVCVGVSYAFNTLNAIKTKRLKRSFYSNEVVTVQVIFQAAQFDEIYRSTESAAIQSKRPK